MALGKKKFFSNPAWTQHPQKLRAVSHIVKYVIYIRSFCQKLI